MSVSYFAEINYIGYEEYQQKLMVVEGLPLSLQTPLHLLSQEE